MTNKKLVLGIAAGAAVLATAAVLIAKRRNNNIYRAHVDEAKENFKHKLHELKRKAEKEYKSAAGDAGELVNAAKERAQEWAGKAAKA
jgi:gas vesicle protein